VLFRSILGNSSVSVGGFAGVAVGVAGLFPMSSPFVAAAVLLIAIFLMKTVGILVRDLVVAYIGAKILYGVRKQIMEQYAGAEYQFMVDTQQGALMYSGLLTPASVSNLHLTISKFVTSLMKIAAIMVVLFSLLPYPALAFIGLGLVYYCIIHYVSKKVSFHLGQGRTKASIEQTIITNEFLNGFRQIISFNIARAWVTRFDRVNRNHCEYYAKDLAWQAIPRPLLELSAMGILLGFVLLWRTTSPDSFSDNLAALGVFAVALVQILPSINTFGGTRIQLMSSMADVQIAHQVLTTAVPARREGHREIASFEKAIVFEDVSFAHKGREILMDKVNMTFEKGKVTAIVGPSGSGKTTLINLILGLFSPSSGRITVDGIPVQELTNETWLGRIGFVSQDTYVYNNTVGENIRFNRESYSHEEIVRAATIANANEFISELPEGYDSMVGDRGVKLSGGQQQRICIARAVVGSPEILLFDEATSSLDSISEHQVQKAIDNASVDRTVIIIAHRLSTIRHADKIIVLDQGKVVDAGTHQELVDRKGEYAHMVSLSS